MDFDQPYVFIYFPRFRGNYLLKNENLGGTEVDVNHERELLLSCSSALFPPWPVHTAPVSLFSPAVLANRWSEHISYPSDDTKTAAFPPKRERYANTAVLLDHYFLSLSLSVTVQL